VDVDPFNILGLPPAFDLPAEQIERAYLRLAHTAHPDRCAEQEAADARAALLNYAHETLADPERRAEALLRRLGGPGREQDRSLPPGFLERIMEVREALEAAVASGDDAEHRKWRDWAARQRQDHQHRVSELFRSSPPPLAEIRRELNAWRYIERMMEQMG
jgi:curved DNA-binding protein CbpA